jgi:hypothetical protein
MKSVDVDIIVRLTLEVPDEFSHDSIVQVLDNMDYDFVNNSTGVEFSDMEIRDYEFPN